MWRYGDGSGGAGWLVMTVTVLALAALLLGAAFLVWRAAGRDTGSAGRTPERQLDERFARGEIDEEEYLRSRDLLRSAR
jgi:putative membrane protein